MYLFTFLLFYLYIHRLSLNAFKRLRRVKVLLLYIKTRLLTIWSMHRLPPRSQSPTATSLGQQPTHQAHHPALSTQRPALSAQHPTTRHRWRLTHWMPRQNMCSRLLAIVFRYWQAATHDKTGNEPNRQDARLEFCFQAKKYTYISIHQDGSAVWATIALTRKPMRKCWRYASWGTIQPLSSKEKSLSLNKQT